MGTYNFISLNDSRHSEQQIEGHYALKLYGYHERLCGTPLPIIEQDGLEVDPVLEWPEITLKQVRRRDSK